MVMDFMRCPEMSGNGAMTGTVQTITQRRQEVIRLVHRVGLILESQLYPSALVEEGPTLAAMNTA